MRLSGGSEVSGSIPVWGKKRFIKSQVRVGLGILTDLNRHLPSNVTTMETYPLIGETRLVHYFLLLCIPPYSDDSPPRTTITFRV